MTTSAFRSINRCATTSPAKFALPLLLALAAGCGANPNEPKADVPAESAVTTDEATAAADNTDATTTTTANTPATNPESVQDSPLVDGQEPGYVGYPLMGETATGEVIRYISSASLDCSGEYVVADCNRSVTVSFIQTNPSDPYVVSDGRAVANCARGVLTEVIIDEDLVAYELNSPDAAMTQLLDYTCEEARTTGLLSAQPAAAPAVPAGLTEGMPYSEVRSRLITEGWIPKDVQMSHYTPLEQEMYDKGYTEVLGCSGTGLCRFEFDYTDSNSLPNGQALVVITAFADSDVFYEGEPLLSVANTDFSFSDELAN